MTINLLDYFLVTQLTAFFIIFCRVGTALMLMPGFGEIYVNPRVRLIFALAFSLILTPLTIDRMPTMPESTLGLVALIIGESLIGAFFGILVRTMLSCLHVAGNIIATQSSLAVASIFDPSSGSQAPVISNLFTVASLTLFFVLNLHHLMLAALVQSYDVFPAGQFPSVSDMNILHTRVMADAFALGVMLAAPHIIFSLLFYVAGGLMTRLMPNFQVFFIAMSPQIMIALILLFASLPMVLDIAMNFVQTQLTDFVRVE